MHQKFGACSVGYEPIDLFDRAVQHFTVFIFSALVKSSLEPLGRRSWDIGESPPSTLIGWLGQLFLFFIFFGHRGES